VARKACCVCCARCQRLRASNKGRQAGFLGCFTVYCCFATGNHRRVSVRPAVIAAANNAVRPAVIAAANNAALTRVRELASDHRASHCAHEMHSKCKLANEIANTGSLRKLEKSKRERLITPKSQRDTDLMTYEKTHMTSTCIITDLEKFKSV